MENVQLPIQYVHYLNERAVQFCAKCSLRNVHKIQIMPIKQFEMCKMEN